MVRRVTYVLRLALNLLRLLRLPVWLYARWARARGGPHWVSLHLKPRLVPFRGGQSWLSLWTAPRELRATSLEEVRRLTRSMADDARVVGLLLHVPQLEAGWAACESLRDTLVALRAAGKQLVCYVAEGGGNRELFVATAADRIYVTPYTSFGPLGLSAQPLYIRPLLDRIGIAVEAQAEGEYKSAAEPALRDMMSEPAREQLSALLEARHDALEQALRGRGLSEERVQRIFEHGLLQATDAVQDGIVDGMVYADELHAQIGCADDEAEKDTAEPRPRSRLVPASAYLRRRNLRLWEPLRKPANIAIIPLRGTIANDPGGALGQGVRPSALSSVVRRVSRDPSVQAIVFYIDSPGGSAHASELMHREIARLAKKKPTIACFGDVAASGGYYLACACQKIVAQPLSITGSIGVVSAKVDAGALLDRLGVRPQFLRTAPSADMLSFARGLSQDEQALLREHAHTFYQRFLTVVAQGRGRTTEQIEPLARGRVWSGRDACERGLVDVLGGLPQAVDQAKALVDSLSAAQQQRLQPRVYPLPASAGLGGMLESARLSLLEPWLGLLPDMTAFEVLRREAVAYYASWTTPLL